MATKAMKLCDSCGKLEAARIEVQGIDMKITDGTRVTGDLCNSCLGRLVKDFGLEQTVKRRRSQFKVTEIE